MQSETDYNKRVELLNQWQTWFVENLPCCHLFVPNNTYAADTTNFTGWHLSPAIARSWPAPTLSTSMRNKSTPC